MRSGDLSGHCPLGGGERDIERVAVAVEEPTFDQEPVTEALDRSGRGRDELVTDFDNDGKVAEDEFLLATPRPTTSTRSVLPPERSGRKHLARLRSRALG